MQNIAISNISRGTIFVLMKKRGEKTSFIANFIPLLAQKQIEKLAPIVIRARIVEHFWEIAR